MKITWKGKGLKEKHWNNKEIISIDKNFLDQQKLSRCLGTQNLQKKSLNEAKVQYKFTLMIEEENKKLNETKF